MRGTTDRFQLFAHIGVAAIALAAGVAHAQWTSDNAVNTPVALGSGDQGTPMTVAAPDGATWITHTDNSVGGYKYVVQRLDNAGVAQFSPGIVISPNRTNTATYLYDIEMDAAGDAILAFDDNAVYVQKVLPNGTLAWGPNGALIPGSAGLLGPRVCAMADGGAVVCVGNGVNLQFQRVNPDGTMGAAWTFTETGRAQLPSDMLATSTPGEFILLWVRAEGTNSVTSRKGLKIQKWDAANNQVWNGHVPVNVYTSGASPSKGIQIGYFPKMVSDGANGAIVAWYDTGAARNSWLQHVNADGTFKFVAEGIPLSTVSSATEFRGSAAVVYHPVSHEYTVAYERSNTTQSIFGLNAQRVSSTGSLLWGGGAGVVLEASNPVHSSFVTCASAPNDEGVVTWLQYAGSNSPMGVQSMRLQASGAFGWESVVDVATNSTNKGRLTIVNSTSGDWMVATWGDGPDGNQDVKAMRINADGSLGAGGPTCDSIDFNNDGLFPDTQDITDFLNVFAGGPCTNDPNCGDIDFNNDGLFPDTDDINALLNVFSGGAC